MNQPVIFNLSIFNSGWVSACVSVVGDWCSPLISNLLPFCAPCRVILLSCHPDVVSAAMLRPVPVSDVIADWNRGGHPSRLSDQDRHKVRGQSRPQQTISALGLISRGSASQVAIISYLGDWQPLGEGLSFDDFAATTPLT